MNNTDYFFMCSTQKQSVSGFRVWPIFRSSFATGTHPNLSRWFLDLTKVTTLSLEFGHQQRQSLRGIQAVWFICSNKHPTFSRWLFRSSWFSERYSSSVDEICSTVIRHVDGSKLRHLEVLVRNLNHVEMFLDHFRGLFSICFLPIDRSITSGQTTTFVKKLMPDCSLFETSLAVSIWIGKRLDRTTNSNSSTS